MKKNFLSTILAFAIVFTSVQTQCFSGLCENKVLIVSAEDSIYTGECGNDATYKFNYETGTLTISGTGAIKEKAFDDSDHTWIEAVRKVVIENGITDISTLVFSEYTSLASVILGSTVPNGFTNIPKNVKVIIPVSIYDSYKQYEEEGYEFGFSDIKGVGYILDGKIGVKIQTNLTVDELIIKCGDTTICLTQKEGYVEFYVAARDMAENYTIYYRKDDGNIIEIALFNPKNSLAGYKYSKYEAVSDALMTYCEAANIYFNGGTVDDMSAERMMER